MSFCACAWRVGSAYQGEGRGWDQGSCRGVSYRAIECRASLTGTEMCCLTGEALDALLDVCMHDDSIHRLSSMKISLCHYMATRRIWQCTTGVM